MPTASSLSQLCRKAEHAGASGLWACDHVFWHGPVLECMTSLALAASATERATLGSCVLQLPLRDSVLAAKQAASLQHLSGGRLVLGLGVGSHRGEYEAAGADFHHRGRRLDQDVATLRALWTTGIDGATPDGPSMTPADERRVLEDRALLGASRAHTPRSLDASGPGASVGDPTVLDGQGPGAIAGPGPYHQLPAGVDIPIWFGGSSAASRARTAAMGDGWLPLFVSPDRYPEALVDLRRRCEDHDRDPASVVPAMVAFVSVAASASSVDAAMASGARWMSSLYRIPAKAFARHLVCGTAADCASALAHWLESGATHVAVFVTTDDPLAPFEDVSTELHHVLGLPSALGLPPTLVPT